MEKKKQVEEHPVSQLPAQEEDATMDKKVPGKQKEKMKKNQQGTDGSKIAGNGNTERVEEKAGKI